MQAMSGSASGRAEQQSAGTNFAAGALVVVSLASPREKYWGELLELGAAGVSVRAIALDSFDDFAAQVRAGERVDAAVLFFPMHRLERIELDARNGDVESLAERFESKSGKSVRGALQGKSPSGGGDR